MSKPIKIKKQRMQESRKAIEKIPCHFCKTVIGKHVRHDLVYHLAFLTGYVHKLRTVQKMTADDRKILVSFIKKHSTKSERRKLFSKLRYTYDFPEFWDERKKMLSKRSKRK